MGMEAVDRRASSPASHHPPNIATRLESRAAAETARPRRRTPPPVLSPGLQTVLLRRSARYPSLPSIYPNRPAARRSPCTSVVHRKPISCDSRLSSGIDNSRSMCQRRRYYGRKHYYHRAVSCSATPTRHEELKIPPRASSPSFRCHQPTPISKPSSFQCFYCRVQQQRQLCLSFERKLISVTSPIRR